MANLRLRELPLTLLLLLAVPAVPAAAQLPYTPSRILQSSQDGDIVYVFGASTNSANQSHLLSLNVSKSLDPSNLPYTTLYPSLPFTSTESSVPYIPVIDGNGNLAVYAGECGVDVQNAGVWRFRPNDNSSSGNGTWSKEDMSGDQGGEESTLLGPNFLTTGISFSSTLPSNDSSMYIFAGMCPNANATEDTWQSAASYSNAMLQLRPQSASEKSSYVLDIAPSRGPPVAEAGFSLTSLPATYSNKSDGTVDQQQNFVLLGGHTATAFINMSQAALYSLPQETWTYPAVDQPSTGQTGLDRRDSSEVEPRSGHTAVLTQDGSRIIVFGGWIGDVDTPADPQLAILSVGEGYGGEGSWSWTIPSTSGSGLADGAGIYGHGATMLSGGVMMVSGGYSISATSSRFRTRATTTSNTANYFFNVTSGTWLSQYQPATTATSTADTSGDSSLSSRSKVGIGVGLGIGGLAILSMFCFYFWHKHQVQKRRDSHLSELRALALNARGFHPDELGHEGYEGRTDLYATDDMMGREGAGDVNEPWYNEGHRGWRSQRGHEAERTGLLVEIPSPTRGLRRSVMTRGPQSTPPRFDDPRMNRGYGDIGVIEERDEEDSQHTNSAPNSPPEMAQRRRSSTRFSILSTAPTLDPFTDPDPLGSHPIIIAEESPSPSPSPPANKVHFPTSLGNTGKRPVVTPGPPSAALARAADVRSWIPDSDLLGLSNSSSSRSGLSSPDKSDRTGSNLSERSGHSNTSSRSGAASIARTLSTKSAALLSGLPLPFGSSQSSPQSGGSGNVILSPGAIRLDTATTEPSGNGDADSFTTAKTSFAQLQAEGEALLGGRPADTSDIPATDAHNNHTVNHAASAETLNLSSPVVNHFATRDRSRSWLGSVRHAIARHTTTDSHSRTLSLTSPGVGEPTSPTHHPFNHRRTGSHSPTSMLTGTPGISATSNPLSGAPPRRAASDASFWSSKRGSRAWTDDTLPPSPWRDRAAAEEDWGEQPGPRPRQRRSTISYSDGGDDEGEWDIEAAVENRVVQVMFTVPRQRLRVVNAAADDAGSFVAPEEREDPVNRIESPEPLIDMEGGQGDVVRSPAPRSLGQVPSLTPTRAARVAGAKGGEGSEEAEKADEPETPVSKVKSKGKDEGKGKAKTDEVDEDYFTSLTSTPMPRLDPPQLVATPMNKTMIGGSPTSSVKERIREFENRSKRL